MKIVVLGAGALGAYFGSRWEQIGQDVTFLVRERRAKQLKDNGLLIHSVKGEYAIKGPKVAEDTKDIDSADLVLLSVKGYHLEGTIKPLKELVAKGAKVLPILNGVEHISILQKELGEEAVLGGLSFIISTLDDKGDVVHTSPFHDLLLGALHPSQESLCKKIESISQNANMNVVNKETITAEMWKKYMFITAFSGITTATNLPIGEIRNQPATFEIAKQLVQDMRKLANAHSINIDEQEVENAITSMQKLNEEATSSMHQDRRKGLTLEVEHLQGGALRFAKQAGVSLPYVETIYGVIKPFENK
ncbi:ketopantoate reductase family protein [Aquibacillus kalidii]|uniref:ketopantoate reductase family protein n=1 Tax=Aquibacillus kalidii TaxID=2762597 RepID=UPI0016466AAD|nr:ketopantoate reductase family protein [Aquibacillus kalidii]